MARILKLWASILVVVMTSMLAIFTAVVAYQVVSRYVAFIPRLFWTEEISRFSFIWMVFLGTAVAVRQRTHFIIDLIPDSFTKRYGRLLDAGVIVALLICAAFMVFGGIHFFEIGMKRVSTVSGLRLAWIYLAIPVSGISIIAFLLEDVWNLLTGRPLHGEMHAESATQGSSL